MKTKRFLEVLLTLVMVVSLLSGFTLTTSAEETSGSCGENVTWEYNTDTKTLTISGSGAMYNTYTSTNLPPWMADYKDLIENVVINEGVTNVGKWAFYKCANLQKVIIPNGVTAIELRAFSNCPKLEEINIPSSVTTIGVFAFWECSSLNEIIIPNGVTELAGFVIYKCTNLKGITIPDSVTAIANAATLGLSSIKELTIPSSVKTINGSIFMNASNLTEVTIPANITKLWANTFYNATNLERVYYLGKKDVEVTDDAMNEAPDFTVYVSNDYEDDTFAGKQVVKTTLHAITFDMGGYGIKPTDRYAADGEIMEEPFTHSDENAVFQGWYKDAERSVEWNFATDTVTSDTVLYAKWKEKEQFTVAFDLNGYGSNAPENQTVSENSKVAKPADPTEEYGFTFGGWYKEAECNNAWDFNVDVVTANTTLYAKWIQIPVVAIVTLDATYGTCDVKSITVSADGTLSEELPTPTPNDTITEGYWFKGWYDSPTGGNEITADTEFLINTTIYAQWDVVKPEIIEYNTEKVDFTFPKAGENIIVIFADYKEWDDPTFVGIKYVCVTTTKTQGEEVISVAVPTGVDLFAGDKIMIWKDMTTIEPLCEAYSVSGRESPVKDDSEGIDLPIDTRN